MTLWGVFVCRTGFLTVSETICKNTPQAVSYTLSLSQTGLPVAQPLTERYLNVNSPALARITHTHKWTPHFLGLFQENAVAVDRSCTHRSLLFRYLGDPCPKIINIEPSVWDMSASILGRYHGGIHTNTRLLLTYISLPQIYHESNHTNRSHQHFEVSVIPTRK